tara:strand:+ start:271 stop:378 length:108 start_codon:yes stop_codon:yes gene_type:complete
MRNQRFLGLMPNLRLPLATVQPRVGYINDNQLKLT